jgi:putative transposase
MARAAARFAERSGAGGGDVDPFPGAAFSRAILVPFLAFERSFEDLGLPGAIRTDNGVPFASPNALFGRSRISIWWLRRGIDNQLLKPGDPRQNGRHERMHLTLEKEATNPASFDFLQQQERFDQWMTVYNAERPHQALGGRTRATCIHLRLAPTRGRVEPAPDPFGPEKASSMSPE